MNVVAEGRFKKRLVPSIKQYGRYRGAGRLEVLDASLRVVGRHVYSLGTRLWVGAAFAVGLPLLSDGRFAIGWLLIYPLVEYWWLQRGTLDIPFSMIAAVGTEEDETIVAVCFAGHPGCSPIVLESPDWKPFAEALKAQIGHSEPIGTTLDLTLNSAARSGLRLSILSILVAVPILQSFIAGFGLWDSVKGLRRASSMAGRGSGAAKAGIVLGLIGCVESVAVLWLFMAAFIASAK